MRICNLEVANFRGIKEATILLPDYGVLTGDNNTGKTTLLEAIDLALGPDRLNRRPPIDEHDFFNGRYLPAKLPTDIAANDGKRVKGGEADAVQEGKTAPDEGANSEEVPTIRIDVTVVDLNDEQKAHFGDAIEFWDNQHCKLYEDPNPEGVDPAHISEAIRVTFLGWYEAEEDDFEGKTFFTRSLTEGESYQPFSKTDKQRCGFLYLRSLRTGSRALSLERGSLLDIILRLKEIRPQMWETTLSHLADYDVASDPALGISGVLESINASLKQYVPKEWGIHPHLKVSNLTREHLRKIITAFIATGDGGAMLESGVQARLKQAAYPAGMEVPPTNQPLKDTPWMTLRMIRRRDQKQSPRTRSRRCCAAVPATC